MLRKHRAPRTNKRREYRVAFDAYSPETMPAARLAEYVADLAKVFWNGDHLYLVRIDPGSTIPVLLADYEAEPKIRERIRSVKCKDGPHEGCGPDVARGFHR
jgi:hypothetical protein